MTGKYKNIAKVIGIIRWAHECQTIHHTIGLPRGDPDGVVRLGEVDASSRSRPSSGGY